MHPILTQFTTTVAFLVQKRKSDSQPIPMGSAFFVGVPRQEQPIEYVTYIVTARHNTEYAEKSKNCYLRVNTTTGRFDDIKINHDDWISADRTDITIMPIKLSDDVDCRFLPAQTLLTEQQVARRDIIREGSQIYIPSLFSRFYGRDLMSPIMRTGTIALLPSEDVTVNLGPYNKHASVRAYLISACHGADVAAHQCSSTMSLQRSSSEDQLPSILGFWDC